MAKRISLDEVKKREICAVLAVGCSRATAARYVGCAPSTIRRTMTRDPEFALAVRRAEQQAEIKYMGHIQSAAKKEQYWRAAAWALERCYPERYAARGPDVITVPQIVEVLARLAEIITAEIPVERYRKAVIKRLDAITADLQSSTATRRPFRKTPLPPAAGQGEDPAFPGHKTSDDSEGEQS